MPLTREINNSTKKRQGVLWRCTGVLVTLSMLLLLALPASLVSAQSACGATVTVQQGDTLNRIAARCDTTVSALLQANPSITNPNRIYVGQSITIPGDSAPGDGNPGQEAAVSFSPTEGPASTVVSVTISNFPPNADATIAFGTIRQSIVTEAVQTDATGMASAQITVPDVQPVDATYRVGAFATEGSGVVEAYGNFFLQSDDGDDGDGATQVSISPMSGPPNTILNVTGSGFPANTGLIVGLGEPESELIVQRDVTAGADGNFSAQFEIPGNAQADQRFIVVAYVPETDIPRATSQPFVTEGAAQTPDLTISPTEGPPGTTVNLQSSGYTANLPVEIGFGQVASEYDIIGQATTDGSGTLNRQVQVPTFAEAGGEYLFVVVPADTGAEVISNVFTVTGQAQPIDPNVNISPQSGPVGSNLQIAVSGFLANTRVSYGLGEPSGQLLNVMSARTNANGAVQLSLQVPEVEPGTDLVVTVYVPRQNGANTISDAFTVTQEQDDSGGNLFTRTNIYLVALEDGGQSGQEIGCGDSVVPVEVQIEPTIAPLTAALETLFGINDRFYGQSGLYNALYQSDLAVERIDLVSGVASIYLTGDLRIGGVCDEPRFRAQIEETALQYYTVNEVRIFVNGEPLSF